MNSKRILLLVTASLVLASCKETLPDSDGNGGEEKLPPVALQLSSEPVSRTVLGDEEGGVYRVWWSDGDRVCVNGVKSSMLIGAGEKAAKAEFKLEGVKAPYHVVYPSIRCSSMTPDGKAKISLPAVQSWIKGSFSSGAAMLYGTSESGEFSLHNLCGVVRIPVVKGASYGDRLNSVTLSSSSAAAPLSGSFILDTVDGSLECSEGDASLLLPLPAGGLALDDNTPEYIHICIPGGEYPEGFNIILANDEGSMLCEWTSETEVPAGVMVTLPQIAFKPSSTKLIDSIDSWNEFAAAVNEGDYERWINDETGEASIVGDISYGGDLTAITTLPAGLVLNGNGHVIKRAAATEPLIVLVDKGATVKNLTVGGTRVAPSPTVDRGTGNLAAFNRGLIENCESQMDVRLTGLNTTVVIGGLVTDNAGVIKDSRNSGDISITMNISANRNVYGGGICGRGFRPLNGVQFCGDFINCENSGSITIYRTASGNFSMCRFAIAGIVGCLDYGVKDECFTTVRDCSNKGSITVWQDDKHTNANYSYSVGGIVGRCCIYNPNTDFYYLVGGASATAHDGYYVVIEDCDNSGAIDVSIASQTFKPTDSGARQVYVGGIAGCLQSRWDSWASVSGCTSVGTIRTGHLAATDITGGIVGGGGYLNISNCRSDISVGLSKNELYTAKYMGLSGAILGLALRDMEVKDCEGALVFDKGTSLGYRGTGYVGGAAHNGNIKEHVANVGYASLTLSGTNWFSGTINGEAVKLENVAMADNEGKIFGTITLK